MDILPDQIPYREFYGILIGSVAPRPIAWVSSISADGQPNLAPFSFFNVISGKPPILGFSPGLRRLEHGHTSKDTLRNIRETGEFVVNVVTFDLAEAMNLTSGEFDPSVNEFEMAKLATAPSTVVRPPRVAESPVSFECKLYQIMDFGTDPPSGSFVMGEIVALHVSESVTKEGRLDPVALDLVGRMGGTTYAMTRERFDLERPKVAGKG